MTSQVTIEALLVDEGSLAVGAAPFGVDLPGVLADVMDAKRSTAVEGLAALLADLWRHPPSGVAPLQ